MKVDAFLSFEKAVAGVDAQTLDVEHQKVDYVLLQPFEKVDNVLLSFEEEVLDAAVLPFVLETQKVGYVLPLLPFARGT